MEDDRIKASPAIKRIAKQYGIDLNDIVGTGEDGRIEVSDLEGYLLGRRHMSAVSSVEAPEEIPEDQDKYAIYQQEDASRNYSRLNYDDEDYVTLGRDEGLDIELYPEKKYDEFMEASFEDPETVADEDLDRYMELEEDFTKAFPTYDAESADALSGSEIDAIADDVADELRYDLMENAVNAVTEEPLGAEEAALAEEPAEDEAAKLPGEDGDGCGCGHHHEDGDECGCGHHHEDEEVCQPINISFRVPRAEIDRFVYSCGSDHVRLLADTVIKALALAIYDEDNEFDGRIDLVRFSRDGIEVSTAMNALSEKVGYISYDDPEENGDVFVNVWDMTEFGFSAFSRPDAGMVNVFVSLDGSDLIIDTVSDEYAVAIDNCAFMFRAMRENLLIPSRMNERSETPVIVEEE
ncbi:MAG: E3 binding domain-containing protein [Eubacteriaceae bacterium]|nr:E3 binding domain-containing protein [Eubacteriaceae bacterium]